MRLDSSVEIVKSEATNERNNPINAMTRYMLEKMTPESRVADRSQECAKDWEALWEDPLSICIQRVDVRIRGRKENGGRADGDYDRRNEENGPAISIDWPSANVEDFDNTW